MVRFRKIAAVLLLAFLLAGCSAKKPAAQKQRNLTVVRVEVRGRHENEAVRRNYESQEKMNAVLNYLRLLKVRGRIKKTPVQTTYDAYDIYLHYAGGGKSCWRIRQDRYYCQNTAPWQLLAPQQAGKLFPLLFAMPSDIEMQQYR